MRSRWDPVNSQGRSVSAKRGFSFFFFPLGSAKAEEVTPHRTYLAK
jgi:hypothetical protein